MAASAITGSLAPAHTGAPAKPTPQFNIELSSPFKVVSPANGETVRMKKGGSLHFDGHAFRAKRVELYVPWSKTWVNCPLNESKHWECSAPDWDGISGVKKFTFKRYHQLTGWSTTSEHVVDMRQVLNKPAISSPKNGATVDTPRPAMVGTGVAGARVSVKESDGRALGSATVGEDGRWSVTPVFDLSDSAHRVEAVQTLKNGAASEPDKVSFTIAAKASAPVITSPRAESTVGSLVKFEGTADYDAGVRKVVLLDRTTGKRLAQLRVGSDGKWWTAGNNLVELAPGKHTIGVVGITSEGLETKRSEVTVIVDNALPKVAIETPENGSAQGTLVKFEGTADRASGIKKVTLRDEADNKLLATLTVSGAGRWWTSKNHFVRLEKGRHSVIAAATGSDGSVHASRVAFTVE